MTDWDFRMIMFSSKLAADTVMHDHVETAFGDHTVELLGEQALPGMTKFMEKIE